MFALVAFGAVVFVIGLGYLAWALRTPDHRVRRRLREPAASIGDGDPSARAVRVTGTVVAGPDGLVTAPRSGEPCVLYRFNAMRSRGHESHVFETVHRETGEVPFLVEDEAGRRTLVRTEHFQLVMRTEFAWEGSRLHVPSDLREWLTGVLGQDPVGMSGRFLRFEEKWIAPGQTVTAIGHLRRDGPMSTVLSDAPGEPLFLTNFSPKEALRELGSNTRAAIGFAVVGAAMTIAGAIVWAIA